MDLSKGESFGVLGFEFRWVRSLQGKWRPAYTPKLRQRTALLRKLKDLFRRFQSQPVERVIEVINPILRGWVQYFAIGHASQCFGFINAWVEKKVRRHLMRTRKLRGFGWTRWSSRWLYDTLGLFHRNYSRILRSKDREDWWPHEANQSIEDVVLMKLGGFNDGSQCPIRVCTPFRAKTVGDFAMNH